MSQDREVWTYVGHKDGKYAGAISGFLEHNPARRNAKREAQWKKEIAKFCGEFIADGFEITKCYSREEYDALITPMGMWQGKKESKKADGAQLPLALVSEEAA